MNHYASLAAAYEPEKALIKSHEDLMTLLADQFSLNMAFRYQPQKWSLSQVFQHLLDTEQVFAFRALMIARSRSPQFQSFDQDEFALSAQPPWQTSIEWERALSMQRRSTINLLVSIPDSVMYREAPFDGFSLSPYALFLAIAGHTLHHVELLKSNYFTGDKS